MKFMKGFFMFDRFACPTMDSTFKLLFGEDSHKKITLAFLNDILDRQGENEIKDIDFIKQEQTPRRFDERKMILDISCKTKAGHKFIIEMQRDRESYFKKRAVAYSAQLICRQLSPTESYIKLMPVIFIGILGDEGNDETINKRKHTESISHNVFMDKDTKEQSIDLIELVFVDLKKFNKPVHELENPRDKWLFFLKRAMYQKDIPKEYNDSPIIQEAFRVMERMNWSDAQMYHYEEELRAFKRDLTQKEADEEERKKLEAERINLEKERKKLEAEKDRLEKEKEELLQEVKVSKHIGLEQGAQKKAEEMALNFLKLGVSIEQVSQGTGLSIEQVENLKK